MNFPLQRSRRIPSGDNGQRYEIRYGGAAGESVFGWASTIAGAATLVNSIDLHPAMNNPRVLDRHKAGAEIPIADVRAARRV
jgi:hypothetical protein